MVQGYRGGELGHARLRPPYLTPPVANRAQTLVCDVTSIIYPSRCVLSPTTAHAALTLSPTAITSTLEAQHTTFIALAAKTAAVDAEVQKIKAVYTQMWRAKTGSMRDPFNELDRGSGNDFGLESIGGK